MDASLKQRIEEGRALVRQSTALDSNRPFDPEIDQLRRGMERLIHAAEVSGNVGHLRVGDVLEWAAGLALVVGAYFASGLAWPAVVVAGLFLTYQAQCYAGRPLRKRSK